MQHKSSLLILPNRYLFFTFMQGLIEKRKMKTLLILNKVFHSEKSILDSTFLPYFNELACFFFFYLFP